VFSWCRSYPGSFESWKLKLVCAATTEFEPVWNFGTRDRQLILLGTTGLYVE